MAQLNVELLKGLTLRDQDGEKESTYSTAILREVTTDDLIEAALESERVVVHPQTGEAVLTNSPFLEGMNILRRQVVSIGPMKGPLTLAELKKLDPLDLDLLQRRASQFDAVGLDASQKRGEFEGDRDTG